MCKWQGKSVQNHQEPLPNLSIARNMVRNICKLLRVRILYVYQEEVRHVWVFAKIGKFSAHHHLPTTYAFRTIDGLDVRTCRGALNYYEQ